MLADPSLFVCSSFEELQVAVADVQACFSLLRRSPRNGACAPHTVVPALRGVFALRRGVEIGCFCAREKRDRMSIEAATGSSWDIHASVFLTLYGGTNATTPSVFSHSRTSLSTGVGCASSAKSSVFQTRASPHEWAIPVME